jgi:two-component system sensor histidine kinase BaeS
MPPERRLRLTIARKIALAVIAIVITCVGTMAWVTSINLKRGFIDYLNHIQAQDLDQFGERLAARYRQEGNFDWLRHNRRALREIVDQMTMVLQSPEASRPPRPEQNQPPGPEGRRPPRPEDNLPPGPEGRRPPRPDDDRPFGPDGRRPPRLDDDRQMGPEGRRPPRPDDDRPLGPDGRRPPRGEEGPPEAGEAPPRPRDAMGFASRLSIIDAEGRSLIGPPEFPPGIERAIVVDGKTVARMRLLPLREAANSDSNAVDFVRDQLRDILWLASILVILSILSAVWLARHLLRPVAALRAVTERLARGQFDARAPLLSRDEVAELALHVNAMAQSLEESEQQRRKMLADISHELRTPLTVIRGEIEALIDGIREADGRALESLHAEVLHLTKLVEDLHQLNLADAGHLQFDWQRFDLAAHLQPLLERHKLRAGDSGLSLQWEFPGQPLEIDADASRITQVMVNLLENSLRYTDKGGAIVVTLERQGAFAELSVEDSAPGVPDGVHASLFERLYRVDAARTRKSGGSGLGLSICKAIVEAHGGTIVALPSRLGGVKMFVRLPLEHQS